MTVIDFPRPIPRNNGFDVICFSHLRWDFVFQRPQHLMTRFAGQGRVFFIEEPVTTEGATYMDVSQREPGLFVCVPHLSGNVDAAETMPHLVDLLRIDHKIDNYITWFYTPMMLEWSKPLSPRAVVYDCMDELSGFKFAPPELIQRERDLFERADIVFTGGHTLYEAKREQHPNVHAFPSSIDKEHFGRAILIRDESSKQPNIPHPRVGFVGVIDERLDIGLLGAIADLRPDWSFVMVGPAVKIDEADLPRRDNIHYLGARAYDELPAVMAGWDAAMMPFALNESTRFISPTKTPEYLAAGLPVASTPISDVVKPYGVMGLVHIGTTPEEFVECLQKAMDEDGDIRRQQVAEFLADNSWDITFSSMNALIKEVVNGRELRHAAGEAR
jgi:UDP-galactopyranose mutase